MTFSITYGVERSPDDHSVDFGFQGKDVWRRTIREYGAVRWEDDGPIDERARRALLEGFGLTDFVDDLSLEKIERMSWQELGLYRRSQEGDGPYLEIKTQALGNKEFVPNPGSLGWGYFLEANEELAKEYGFLE